MVYRHFGSRTVQTQDRHDYTVGTLDVLQACDICADMGMTYSVIVQCTDCVVFPQDIYRTSYKYLEQAGQ